MLRKRKITKVSITAITILMILSNVVSAYETDDYWWPAAKVDPLYYWDFSDYNSEVSTVASDWRDTDLNVQPLHHPTSEEYCWVYLHEEPSQKTWFGMTSRLHSGSYYTAMDVYFCSYYMDSWNSSHRRCTIAHEFGHVHSLNHEDDLNEHALMHSSHTQRWDKWGLNTPQTDDIEGAATIYGYT